MEEEGIQDFIGIMNVTLKGMEDAGKIGITLTRGSLKVAANIFKLLSWIVRSIHDNPYYKTGGKVKNKVLSTKFLDLNYSDMQLYSAHGIYSELNKQYPGNYDQVKIDKLLSSSVLEKEFDKLAKKNGLLYAKIPNFISNKDTNIIEFRFAYSKSQEAALLETKSQMMALISKRLKNCGVKKEVAKKIAEEWIGNTEGKPIMKAMDEIGVTTVSNEVFDTVMKETYPSYDSKEFVAKEPSLEKKIDYIAITDKNEHTQQKNKGNVKDITFSKILVRNANRNEITVVMDEYPNVAIKIRQSDVLNLNTYKDEQGNMVYKASLRKDTTYQFEVYQADPVTKKIDFSNNPKYYEMSLKEFDNMMKQNIQKNRIKIELHLEQKAMLPNSRLSGFRGK